MAHQLKPSFHISWSTVKPLPGKFQLKFSVSVQVSFVHHLHRFNVHVEGNDLNVQTHLYRNYAVLDSVPSKSASVPGFMEILQSSSKQAAV